MNQPRFRSEHSTSVITDSTSKTYPRAISLKSPCFFTNSVRKRNFVLTTGIGSQARIAEDSQYGLPAFFLIQSVDYVNLYKTMALFLARGNILQSL
jgi:hypothetical protein